MELTRYRLFLHTEKYLIHKNTYDKLNNLNDRKKVITFFPGLYRQTFENIYVGSNVLNTRTLCEYYVVPSVRLTCELRMMVRLGPTTRVPAYTPEETQSSRSLVRIVISFKRLLATQTAILGG